MKGRRARPGLEKEAFDVYHPDNQTRMIGLLDGPEPAEGIGTLADFLYEVGHLKSTPRSGWALAGVPAPESVADHAYRTAVIGVVLAELEGADVGRTAVICLMHDIAETRMGDIPSVGKSYVRTVRDTDVAADQTRGVSGSLAELVCDAVAEYTERVSIESVLAKDADTLECLAQAREYVAAGYPRAEHWVQDLVRGLRSHSAKRIAAAMRAGAPENWWLPFVQGYSDTPEELDEEYADASAA